MGRNASLSAALKGAEKDFPIAIVMDRYAGLYSGGEWFAIALADAPYPEIDLDPTRAAFCIDSGPNGTDDEARDFWRKCPDWIAAAGTPDEALDMLIQKREQFSFACGMLTRRQSRP